MQNTCALYCFFTILSIVHLKSVMQADGDDKVTLDDCRSKRNPKQKMKLEHFTSHENL